MTKEEKYKEMAQMVTRILEALKEAASTGDVVVIQVQDARITIDPTKKLKSR